MIISGKTIADEMMAKLTESVATLKKHGVTPTLVAILMRFADKSDTIAAATCLTK